MKKIDKLGWIVAAGLAGMMIGMGFQAPGAKIGTVDLAKVFNDSEFAKKQNAQLQAMGQAREGLLDFLGTYKTLDPKDAPRLKALTVKATLTPVEQAELEKLKKTAMDTDKRYRDLVVKANPSADELAQLTDLNARIQNAPRLQQAWAKEFDEEIRSTQDKLRGETLEKVKVAVNDVAKQQGFSVIFVNEVAPYSANDLTGEALKSVNKLK